MGETGQQMEDTDTETPVEHHLNPHADCTPSGPPQNSSHSQRQGRIFISNPVCFRDDLQHRGLSVVCRPEGQTFSWTFLITALPPPVQQQKIICLHFYLPPPFISEVEET